MFFYIRWVFSKKKPPGKNNFIALMGNKVARPLRARTLSALVTLRVTSAREGGNFVVFSAIFFELVKLSLKLLILKIRNPMF